MVQRRQWHPTPVLLPGKYHGWRSLVGCSPWGRWGSDPTERLHFHFLLSCIGGGNGNPLQCSCLENPRDGGAWWAAAYGVAQSQTQLKWLSSSSLNGWALKARIKLLKYDIWNFYHHWNSVGMPSTLNRNIAILDQNPSDNWTCPKYGIKKTKYLEINLMNDMEVL